MTENSGEFYKQVPLPQPSQKEANTPIIPFSPEPYFTTKEERKEDQLGNKGLPPLESTQVPLSVKKPGEAFRNYLERSNDPVVNRNRDKQSRRVKK